MAAEPSRAELARQIRQHPDIIGRQVGFHDLTPLHGEWIREMVFGQGDYTLQAHRGSYKSSCLAVAISLILIIYPTRNIIFIRKADNDVAEMSSLSLPALFSALRRTEHCSVACLAIFRILSPDSTVFS